MDKKRQVIIVGGGASGLTAGIMAARNGAAVTILEQNEKPGRKICVTGNGRCNLTNQDMSWKYFHGEHPEFAKKILAQFSLEDTLRFFDELGIVVIEKKGWLYPRGRAGEIYSGAFASQSSFPQSKNQNQGKGLKNL